MKKKLIASAGDKTVPSLNNALVKEYMPLVNRLVSQYAKTTKYSREYILSAAMEGLCNAVHDYNPKIGKQTFAQFAAWRIRFAILAEIDCAAGPVSLSSYYTRKMRRDNTYPKSLDIEPIKNDDHKKLSSDYHVTQEYKYNLYSDPEEIPIDEKFTRVIKYIKEHATPRDYDFLCSFYGLGDHKKEKLKDIAARYGVTPGLISQRVKALEVLTKKHCVI